MAKYMLVLNYWDPDQETDKAPDIIRQETVFLNDWDNVLQTICDCYCNACNCLVYQLHGTVYALKV